MFDVGFFGRIASRYWRVLGEMWWYVKRSNILLWLLVFPVFLFYAPFLILAALGFALLVPLDLFAAAIDAIWNALLRFYDRMSRQSGDNFFGFILLPPLLFLLAPIILIIVIVPKVSSLKDDI